MNLHTDESLFKDAVQATADELGIRDVFIEKDYWLTLLLKNLSHSKFKQDVVFKGGTSLSKVYKKIKRFSEDVDLALLIKKDLPSNQIKKQLREIESVLIVDPIQIDGSFNGTKGSKIRRTGCMYPKLFNLGMSGQTAARLILELNAFSFPNPYQPMKVETYIATYFKGQDTSLIQQYDLDEFEVNVMGINRTLTEKIVGLARTSIADDSDNNKLRKKIRHFYDVHKIMADPDMGRFLGSSEYQSMLIDVIKDDLNHPEFASDWTINRLNDVPLFVNVDRVFENLESAFNTELTLLLYPDEDIDVSSVKDTFVQLKNGLPTLDVKAIVMSQL